MPWNHWVLFGMLAFIIFVSCPLWAIELYLKWRARYDPMKRLTEDQFQRFMHEAARQGHAYLKRVGRLKHLEE